MAQPNVPMQGDLATGDIKGRLAKILFEKLMRRAGVAAANTRVLSSLGSFIGDLPPALKSVAGIGGAALIQSPVQLAEWVHRITGGDVGKIHELLNEGMDSLVTSFAGHLDQKQRKTKGYIASDADYEQVVSEWFDKHKADLVVLDPADVPVVVDAVQHVFHDTQCPSCYKGTTKKGGKGPDAGAKQTTYQEGCREVPLKWAIRNGYPPTNGNCCGNTAMDAMQALAQPRQAPPPPQQSAPGPLAGVTLASGIGVLTGTNRNEAIVRKARETTRALRRAEERAHESADAIAELLGK